MFDYHIHSEFSDDSSEKMNNIIDIAERVLSNYEKAIDCLRYSGFEYLTTFENRKKTFHKI